MNASFDEPTVCLPRKFLRTLDNRHLSIKLVLILVGEFNVGAFNYSSLFLLTKLANKFKNHSTS